MITIDFSSVLRALTSWIPTTRWYRGNGITSIAPVASVEVGHTGTTATFMHVLDIDGVLFHVPLTYIVDDGEADVAAAIGQIAGQHEHCGSSEHGANSAAVTVTLADASDNPLGQQHLYQLFSHATDTDVATDTDTNTSGTACSEWSIQAAGQPLHLSQTTARNINELPAVTRAHKLTSEQSNTSIIYDLTPGQTAQPTGIICKLLRVLDDGHNPDVELQVALDNAGSTSVARQYGAIAGSWDGMSHADLFIAQEFLAGATDAWQVITGELTQHGPMMSAAQRERITALGQLTRDIHTQLAHVCPTAPANRSAVVVTWKKRAEQALRDAPELAPLRESIMTIYDDAAQAPWPTAQRIHGDYHLGQVLDVPNRGWVALDFEGEPLRPLAERTQPDLALRDVAGMLRSFDYAAGAVGREEGQSADFAPWTLAATAAFREGYGKLNDDEEQLLRALILDKALYEVSYEATSRPQWIDIPLAGVKALLTDE